MSLIHGIITMPKSKTLQLLHLSDIHFLQNKKFDQSDVLESLIERIKLDKKNGFEPELIVVSGDIAFSGMEDEYQLADDFFSALTTTLELERSQVFMVPGNHDINFNRYPNSDIPRYNTMKDLNDDLENPEFRSGLLRGLANYYEYIDNRFNHMQSKLDRLIPFVTMYKTLYGKTIGLIGLNSAWMCRRNDSDHNRIAIGTFQIKSALAELKKTGEPDLLLYVVHHPLEFMWSVDQTANLKYFQDAFILCGHLHQPKGGCTFDLDGSRYQFQAGAAYENSGWPNRCQYLTFDWNNNELVLDFRKFSDASHIWFIDSETGEDGKKSFPIKYDDNNAKKRPQNQEKIFGKYINTVRNDHCYLSMDGFITKSNVKIKLEHVYVTMRAHVHNRHSLKEMQKSSFLGNRKMDQSDSIMDIRGAFQTTRDQNVKDMVILGDPGSGKTTLLRYIMVMLATGKAEISLGIDSETIPFLAPLRKLKNPESENFVEFITRVCQLNQLSVSKNALSQLLNGGMALILLDGLDEVADKQTRIQVSKWIDNARKEWHNAPFIITSRFAGYLDESKLHGKVLELSVQDFNLEEIRFFLTQWFQTVEIALHTDEATAAEVWQENGAEKAKKLADDIEKSRHVRDMAVNPLLLQIIALIHQDRGARLPERRVELYEECSTVLLEKWDLAKGMPIKMTGREARQLLQPLAFWLHSQEELRSAPMEKIKYVVNESLENLGKTDIDAEALLKDVRDRSGIFTGFSESEYGFTHLSFQEFLAAEFIRNNRNVDLLVIKYNDKWWREVILLALALDNPSIIIEFMEKIIPTKNFESQETQSKPQTGIDIVISAIRDSVAKPAKPFVAALTNPDLDISAKENAIRILASLGTNTAISEIKDSVNNKSDQLANFAYNTLITMNAATDVKKPTIKQNQSPVISDKDKAGMVLIPAGTFLYGSKENDKNADSDEKPQRVIDLPAYYMDVFPVTNAQYCQFLHQSKPDDKTLEKWINLQGNYQKEKCRINKNKAMFHAEKGYDQYPVIYVSWHGASAYAQWAEKHLPTEQEWEKAARGTDGRTYPWGDEFDNTRCNSSESDLAKTSPVNQYKQGKSPYGW